jgi:CheY-like chemotaxis protein
MEHQRLKTLKGLVVGDDVFHSHFISYSLLCNWDISADVASTGEIALEMLTKDLYDFVIMDDMMPGMDGIETTRIIRSYGGKYFENLPVYGLIPDFEKDRVEKAMESGMTCCIVPKPFDFDALYLQLLKCL